MCARSGGGLCAARSRTPDPVALQKKHLKATTINRERSEKLRVVLGGKERASARLLPLDERIHLAARNYLCEARGDQSETNEAGTYAYISSGLAALIYANSTKWYRPTNIAAARVHSFAYKLRSAGIFIAHHVSKGALAKSFICGGDRN